MPVKRLCRARRRAMRGVSLVEVLVTVVVLSIGLLGHAALQARSMRGTQDAVVRLDATMLAYDILDRMRANRARALAGDYDIALGEAASGSTIADLDVQAWKTALTAVRPGADGAIGVNAGVATITVQWAETDGATTTMYLRSQL